MEINYKKSIIHQSVGGEDMETEVFLPDFGDGQEQHPIGIWGQRHLRYIREHRIALYTELLTSGRLNAYLAALNEEAEGMPTTVGKYTFTISATFEGEVYGGTKTDSKTFTIEILDNTDENVDAVNGDEQGYPLLDRIDGTVDVGSVDPDDLVFRSEGGYGDFIAFYLDGVRLKDGVDYDSSEGSTRITIRTITLEGAGNGSHTIAAEFREGGDEDGLMKRSAQNVEVTGVRPYIPPVQPSQPEPDQPTEPDPIPFRDATKANWFYEDVQWAAQNGFMIGVAENEFAPEKTVSLSTALTVFSRMAGVDLDSYTAAYADIPAGQWYSKGAVWARETGLLAGSFDPDKTVSRGELAVMLVKFLRYVGADVTAPASPAAFADQALMSANELEAFQLLSSHDIFLGVGDGKMDPDGTTTRAQLAALMHRLTLYVESGR